MEFRESTQQDIEQLTKWIQADPYHQDCLNPQWWLTGNGLLSYKLQDSKGPVVYVRIDEEQDNLRLHCQFAPESEVSKSRVVKALIWALPKMEHMGKQNNFKGFVYKSVSSSLIQFMQIKFGFVSAGNNDYTRPFLGEES